jgi:hypothetical protein
MAAEAGARVAADAGYPGGDAAAAQVPTARMVATAALDRR